MAFTLSGVISKDEIRDMFIPEVEETMVASNFLEVETVMDADSIKIPGVGAVTVNPYTGTATTTDATDTSVTLNLDQADYFQKAIDKVDNAQSAVKILGRVLQKGAVATADEIDKHFFETLAGASNTVTGGILASTTVAAWISSINVALTNQKCPRRGRKLAVAPEISALISAANLTLNTTTAEEAAREGFVGRYGGFDIFETINLYNSPTFYDALNLTDIPKSAPVEINTGVTGVVSGTAVLGDGTVIGVQTVDGTLYVNDATDEAIADAADAAVNQLKASVAGVMDCANGGIGYQEYGVGEPVEGFKWIAKGLANYGSIIKQQAFIVSSGVSN